VGHQRPLPRRLALALVALLPLYFAGRWALFGGLGGYGSHARLAAAQLLNPLLCLPLATLPVYIETPLDGPSLVPWTLMGLASATTLAWQSPGLMVAYLATFVPITNMMGTLGFATAEVARLMYLPSAMVSANIGALFAASRARWPRSATAALVAMLLMSTGSTWNRLSAWRDASTVTSAVASTLEAHRAAMAVPTLVDCTALPDNVRGAWAYRTGCDAQVRLVLGEGAARGTRGNDEPFGHRQNFASTWCLAEDGATIMPGLCPQR
jgi:hypothetical protein